MRRSHDDALRTGEELVVLLWDVLGCSGKTGHVRASLSSLGSGMLPIPVDVLPMEWFLRWLNSVMLEEREWPVL